MNRGLNAPCYGFTRAVQRVPVDTEVVYTRLAVIEQVNALMRELQPRRVDSDSKAILRVCGRLYN